jgi:hypothetical protein
MLPPRKKRRVNPNPKTKTRNVVENPKIRVPTLRPPKAKSPAKMF